MLPAELALALQLSGALVLSLSERQPFLVGKLLNGYGHGGDEAWMGTVECDSAPQMTAHPAWTGGGKQGHAGRTI